MQNEIISNIEENSKIFPIKENSDENFFDFKNEEDCNISISFSPLITTSSKDMNNFLYFKDENLGDYMADKVINNNKIDKNESSSNDVINPDLNIRLKKLEGNENLNGNNSYNLKKINEISKNKMNNSYGNLFNVYQKKRHTKYNRDNLIDKIIRSFLNNIYYPYIEEIDKIKKYNKLFLKNMFLKKMTNALAFFPKIKIDDLLKLKTKNIFFVDEFEKFNFSKKKSSEKSKLKKIESNKTNKIIMKKITEEKEKIGEIKDDEVKKSILNINEIMNKSLNEMYEIYLTNDKRYESFKTIIDDIIVLEKEGEDQKYLSKYENVAKSLLDKIEECN